MSLGNCQKGTNCSHGFLSVIVQLMELPDTVPQLACRSGYIRALNGDNFGPWGCLTMPGDIFDYYNGCVWGLLQASSG